MKIISRMINPKALYSYRMICNVVFLDLDFRIMLIKNEYAVGICIKNFVVFQDTHKHVFYII